MSITQKLENDYKNIVENIKKLPNSIERDLIIGSLVEDLGKRCISAVSRVIGICREKVKSCYEKFKSGLYNYEWLESAQNAEKIVKNYERGLITDREAMRMLAELSY